MLKKIADRSRERGFTLIELMIVVAIIGILAAIAIPKFADLVRKAQEGKTRGNLTAMRGALSIYYGDNDGTYPQDNLAILTTNTKYLKATPQAHVPAISTENNTGHAATTTVTTFATVAASSNTDTGVWAYVDNTTNSDWGDVRIGCTHNDSKATVWNTR
ncbi:MAG: prepilin-type N-terminal cleavage/methylation domain-containing protein [Elusimicrobia bacterium]|nr:prepilin-type N-terminal cleavage/methylation domain-containing protein [Elusimicrobiota bacterium]